MKQNYETHPYQKLKDETRKLLSPMIKNKQTINIQEVLDNLQFLKDVRKDAKKLILEQILKRNRVRNDKIVETLKKEKVQESNFADALGRYKLEQPMHEVEVRYIRVQLFRQC